MRQLMIPVILMISLSCCSRSETEIADYAHRMCNKVETNCRRRCQEQRFRSCYLDSSQYKQGPYDVRQQCNGVHVGNACFPCENIYALNFGGAMREVKCLEFFSAIRRREKMCDGCMKKVGWSPAD